jgi:hypothetical protein
LTSKLEATLAEAEIPIEFEDEREEALVRTAVVGKDAHDWLSSQLGQFVIGSAYQDQIKIQEALTKVSPLSLFGRRKIAKLQQRHEAVEMAIEWLTDAVRVGMMAERRLEDYNTED